MSEKINETTFCGSFSVSAGWPLDDHLWWLSTMSGTLSGYYWALLAIFQLPLAILRFAGGG
jgi:hypothetical protein